MRRAVVKRGINAGAGLAILAGSIGACGSSEKSFEQEPDPKLTLTVPAAAEAADTTTTLAYGTFLPEQPERYSVEELEKRKVQQMYDFASKEYLPTVPATGDIKVPFKGHQTTLPFEEIGDQGTLLPNHLAQANVAGGICEIYYTTDDRGKPE